MSEGVLWTVNKIGYLLFYSRAQRLPLLRKNLLQFFEGTSKKRLYVKKGLPCSGRADWMGPFTPSFVLWLSQDLHQADNVWAVALGLFWTYPKYRLQFLLGSGFLHDNLHHCLVLQDAVGPSVTILFGLLASVCLQLLVERRSLNPFSLFLITNAGASARFALPVFFIFLYRCCFGHCGVCVRLPLLLKNLLQFFEGTSKNSF